MCISGNECCRRCVFERDRIYRPCRARKGVHQYTDNDFFIVNFLTYFGLFIITAIAGNAACRDFEERSYPLLFTSPVSKFGYFGGRFAASFIISSIIMSGSIFDPGLPPLCHILNLTHSDHKTTRCSTAIFYGNSTQCVFHHSILFRCRIIHTQNDVDLRQFCSAFHGLFNWCQYRCTINNA